MGLIKDIKLFYYWKKILNTYRDDIIEKFNIKIDRAFRIHYVINIPPLELEEPYNIRKRDIDILVEKRLKSEISKLSGYLDSINLDELYDYYEPIRKLEKYSYVVVIGFKLIDSVGLTKSILWSKILLIIISLITSLYLIIK